MYARYLSGATLMTVMLLGGALIAAEPVKSGLQPGDKGVPAFNPLHVTGPDAGGKVCLV